MRTRIVWALVLFSAATWVTARLGAWLDAPALAPIAALVTAAVGAVLIGLAPGSGGASEPAPKAEPARVLEEEAS